MRLVKNDRRISVGPILPLIASFAGGAVVMVLLVLEARTCADWWGRWISQLPADSWMDIFPRAALLISLSLLTCVGLSLLSKGVPGGRPVGLFASFAVGAASWLLPTMIVADAASYFDAGKCSTGFFRVIFIFEFFAICMVFILIATLLGMAISAAWRKSRI